MKKIAFFELIVNNKKKFILIASLIISIFICIWTILFLKYINGKLHIDRKTHLVEITTSVSEVINSKFDSYWVKTDMLAHTVSHNNYNNISELYDKLSENTRIVSEKNAVFMAVDSNFNYYSSNRNTTKWDDFKSLMKIKDKQTGVSIIPGMKDSKYLLFIQKLDNSSFVYDKNIEITHVLIAFDPSIVNNILSSYSFKDRCYKCLIESNGDVVLESANAFSNAPNLFVSFEKFEFINKKTSEDIKKDIKNDVINGYEFKYNNEKVYVANALIKENDWTLLLFVPTSVLASGTYGFMNAALVYFVSMLFIIILTITITFYLIMKNLNNKKLIKQKEENNKLLELAADNANKANEAKSDFLSNMSHDIRTPMNGIMGMTDIALKNIDNKKKVYECLCKINVVSKHLLALINDILDMRRIEKGNVIIKHNPLNINELIDDCVLMVEGQLHRRNIEFIKDFKQIEISNIYGDELNLRLILINLLSNAVKYTPDGKSITFIVKSVKENDKANFTFIISDTGIGMREEFLNKIWEEFSQDLEAFKSNYKGSGLGMSITHRLVNLMGGSISVDSKLGVGTKFVVSISFDINYNEIKNEFKKVELDVSNMKVLLVEDNEINMEIAEYFLRINGVIIDKAYNGIEAIDKFSTSNEYYYDVILMDLRMPLLDGLEACKRIRMINRRDALDIPIIAMTANAYDEDIEATINAGMTKHISKPINEETIISAIFEYKKKGEEKND